MSKQKSMSEVLHEVYGIDETDGYWEAEIRKPTPGELRKKYPSLKDAYEKYQIILALCRAEEDSK